MKSHSETESDLDSHFKCLASHSGLDSIIPRHYEVRSVSHVMQQEHETRPGASFGLSPRAKTVHNILFKDSRDTFDHNAPRIDLVVTSPPYPMIKMWDHAFSNLNTDIQTALSQQDGDSAFELMHRELDKIWTNAYRNRRAGGIMCVNIGDATRTVNGTFKLYANHARILSFCVG